MDDLMQNFTADSMVKSELKTLAVATLAVEFSKKITYRAGV